MLDKIAQVTKVGSQGVLVAGVIFCTAFIESPLRLATAGAILLVVLALLRFDSIGKIQGAGMVLESLTQKAEKATAQAEVTIEQVRKLGVSLSHLSLDVLAGAGLWGGVVPWADRIDLRDKLIAELRALSVDEAEISKVDRTFRYATNFRYAKAVVEAARKECLAHVSPKSTEYQSLEARTSLKLGDSLPDLKDLRVLVEPHMCQEVEEALETYARVLKE